LPCHIYGGALKPTYMKNKIVILTWGLMILATGAFAQQGQKVASAKSNTSAANPNIERMRIVNEKIAAEKATKANQTNELRIAAMNKRNAEVRQREQQLVANSPKPVKVQEAKTTQPALKPETKK